MEPQKENSSPNQTPLQGGLFGSGGNKDVRAVSESVASGWRGMLNKDGSPRKAPGRKPMVGGAAAPGGGGSPGDPSAPGALVPAPSVDRPLVESLFESIIRGLDDHFQGELKATGRQLVKHNLASEKDLTPIYETAKVNDAELIPAKTAFGAICEKYGFLGQYVPELVCVVLVGKMGMGWFIAARRLDAIKQEIKASVRGPAPSGPGEVKP